MTKSSRINARISTALFIALVLSSCHQASLTDGKQAAAPATNDAGGVAPEGASTPFSFLQTLYQAYDQDYSIVYKHPRDYYDPELASFMERRRTIKTDEDDPLGFDPICQCQDPSDMHEQIKIISATPATASAVVLVQTAEFAKIPIHFDLVKISGHWRIHDIVANDVSTVRLFRKAWQPKSQQVQTAG